MSNVFRTEEYEKSGKTVNWLDEFLSSFSQPDQILDLIYDKRGETVESVVNKYKEMVGLEKISSNGDSDISKNASSKLGPISPMKLKKLKNPDDILKKHDDSGVIIQQKVDGFKTQAIKDSVGSVKLFTRRGEGFESNVPQLVSDLEDKMGKDEFWLGELAYIKNNKQSISDIQTIVGSNPERAQKHDGGKIIFYVYDLLWDGGQDITKEPYINRYNKLKSKIGKGTTHIQLVKNYSYADKDKAINDAIKSGGEGIVLKPKNSKYLWGVKGSGEKVGEWAKFKPAAKNRTDEVILNKYSKNEEKLIFPMYQYKNNKLFEVGKLSGMSKEDESKIKKMIDGGKSVVVEITFQDRMSSGKFRHVGWSRFRPDKPTKEVKMSKSIKYISKFAKDESENDSVIVMIEKNPKIKSNLHSICEHSGGHRNTISIINFLRNVLGKELVSFSDDDLKNYIEDIKSKYKEESVEQEADVGLVGLDDTSSEDETADYITHGKGNM